jgi:hypothetical protein
MLNCKLLSTLAADLKDLYFTWCDGSRHGRTLARTLCYGEEPPLPQVVPMYWYNRNCEICMKLQHTAYLFSWREWKLNYSFSKMVTKVKKNRKFITKVQGQYLTFAIVLTFKFFFNLFVNLALEKWISSFIARPLNSSHQQAMSFLPEVDPFIRVVLNVNNMLDKYLSTTHVYHVWDTFCCKTWWDIVIRFLLLFFIHGTAHAPNPDTAV